jgi:hypothetical protein
MAPSSGATETQFRFQGVLAQQKPFRDWLTEILACALGFYTFEFGKLKVGCRINASAVEAFTLGNILFQSLRLEPVEAAFEHLIIEFADQAYQYQANTAEYQDKDHAAYYGRQQAPLTARQHIVGCGTLSQALRLAATRTREEIGGIVAGEWAKARNASWKTTILALATEVGQVVSMTHPDVPGGYGDFRIQRWQLHRDWSISITARTVTPSMYDLDSGPKPVDVTPLPFPAYWYPTPDGLQWGPAQTARSGAVFAVEYSFDCDQEYGTLADGTTFANLIVTGKLPVNATGPGLSAPIIGNVEQTPTGGTIPGGVSLRVAICAVDANGLLSPPSPIVVVSTPAGTNTNRVILNNITWPSVAGLAGYIVFAGTQADMICQQGLVGTLIAGPNDTYTPGTLILSVCTSRGALMLPSNNVSRLRLKAKQLVRSGIMNALVASVDAETNTIVLQGLIGATGYNPTGRTLSAIGRPTGVTPFVDLRIVDFNATTGAVTVTPGPVTIGHPEWSIQAGDVVAIRCLSDDTDNSAHLTSVSDAQMQNPERPGGMAPGQDVGKLLRVIAGTSRGQIRKITGNTVTSWSWDLPLLLDQSSIWIVEEPLWQWQGDSAAFQNADPNATTSLMMPIPNLGYQFLLVAGLTVDQKGNESADDGNGPLREEFIFGSGGLGYSSVAGLAFQMQGTLGIEANAAQPLYLNHSVTAGDVKAYLQDAPTGSGLTFVIYVGGTAWLTLTIPAGQTSIEATPAQIAALTAVPANTAITVGITAVGTTFPGADLSVFIYS